MSISVNKAYLFFAGALLVSVGLYISTNPLNYVVSLGADGTSTLVSSIRVDIPLQVNLLSELRGMGGCLTMIGLFASLGAMVSKWQSNALMISTLVFSSFVIFRSLGMIVDGMPDGIVIFAYGIETLFASSGIALMLLKE